MHSLNIRNFKCFKEVNIPLSHLTIMAGANGNGKSTSIQAILFLRKTIEENCEIENGIYQTKKVLKNTKIALNGGYLLSLGNSSYVLNRQSDSNKIEIGISNNEEKILNINYLADNTTSELFLETEAVEISSTELSILKKAFYYLNAERIGPRVNQTIHYFDYPHTGYQGENVAQIIASLNYTLNVEQERRHENNKSPRLEQQVNAWLNVLIPNTNIVAKQSIETLTAQIQVENYFTKGEPIIATNIGFGISYVLPIIVAGLIAERESYLIIENPEAHLHPSAQSRIGAFLAMIAKAGVYVIVETHSDHVINGIQIAAAKEIISPDLITVNFFNQKDGSEQPIIESISINEKGELSKWPNGFFDQTQLDFAALFKLRKK